MKNTYFKIDPWKIIEKDFDPAKVKASESIFSLGNGAMGQRGNFEEQYTGESFQGSYIGGIYYPDKTKVGWWKNGYPEYFAKVPNAPSWIGIHILMGDLPLDLNKCLEIKNFRRELDMKTGIYTRSFEAQLSKYNRVGVKVKRFLSMEESALGIIHYELKALRGSSELSIDSFIDGHVKNQDSNWNDTFWAHKNKINSEKIILLHSQTLKTEFDVATYAYTQLFDHEGKSLGNFSNSEKDYRISQNKKYFLNEGTDCTIVKFGGHINGMNHDVSDFENIANRLVKEASEKGFDELEKKHSEAWASIWDQSDIQIDGNDKAQQGIRFNIFN